MRFLKLFFVISPSETKKQYKIKEKYYGFNRKSNCHSSGK